MSVTKFHLSSQYCVGLLPLMQHRSEPLRIEGGISQAPVVSVCCDMNYEALLQVELTAGTHNASCGDCNSGAFWETLKGMVSRGNFHVALFAAYGYRLALAPLSVLIIEYAGSDDRFRRSGAIGLYFVWRI